MKSNAEPHVAQAVVWKTDLANFFLAISGARVLGLFRMLGYPERVALALTRLTTTALGRGDIAPLRAELSGDAFAEWERLGTRPHLPQGAPTSPALANLVSYRLDVRLSGLAEQFGATYTRYADDLTFSGDREFRASLPRFRVWALAIIADEGFLIRRRKSIVMPHSRRQQVAGVVVNSKLNASRQEYKLLHAILHNCRRLGPRSQNCEGHADFRAHLQGRIHWMGHLNPERGAKLQEMFDGIEWG